MSILDQSLEGEESQWEEEVIETRQSQFQRHSKEMGNEVTEEYMDFPPGLGRSRKSLCVWTKGRLSIK